MFVTCENDAQTGSHYQNSVRKSTNRKINLRQQAVVFQVGFHFINLRRFWETEEGIFNLKIRLKVPFIKRTMLTYSVSSQAYSTL